jgi:hypothetical protein
MLIALAWLLTLVVLFHAEENWRGRRAWNQTRRELEARGKQLDFKALIPKPVPDEQNFAATPFVQSWFSKRRGGTDSGWNDLYRRAEGMLANSGIRSSGKGVRGFTDLPAWKEAFAVAAAGSNAGKQKFQSDQLDRDTRAKAAPAVVEGLKTSEPILEELREASRKPSVFYPVRYDREDPWGILLPHLVEIKTAVSRLRLRACALLAAGRSDQALADLKLGVFLSDTLQSEPFLISYLVRIACLQIMIQPIWEGLAERRWSDGQLSELQALLHEHELLADTQPPLDTERAAALMTVDLIGKGKNYTDLVNGSPRRRPNPLFYLIPNGWLDLEKHNYCRLFELLQHGTLDLNTKHVSPAQIAANEREFERQTTGGALGRTANVFLHHQLIASLLLPALGKLTSKASTAQVACDQAALACALERFRLANQRFPENLNQLLPRFAVSLPNDCITGKPYIYQRISDEQFLLYSVGWNESDDGGKPGERLFDLSSADWVWESQ